MSAWEWLFRRRRAEDRLDAELRDHLERQAADYVRAGLSEDEARRRARVELGGLEPVKEACREVRSTRLLEDLEQDLRYGVRVLRKSPAFTAVAIVSLALGIGANTAIFTLVDSLILRALPVSEPGRLVRLKDGSWTNPIWEQIRDRQHAILEGAAAFSDTRFDLAAGGEVEPVDGFYASGSFFDVAGVPPMLGRAFTLDDDRRGGGESGPVAVISYGFWQRRYGGAADAVGRTLRLNGLPFTIVGVTPPSFFGPTVGRSFDVAVPIGMVDRVEHVSEGEGPLDGRSWWWLDILGRLKPGQTPEEATRALRRVQPQIREATLPEHWPAPRLEEYLRESLTLVPAANGFSVLRGAYAGPLLTLMVIVALVLLVACANLASLLLARASARSQELGARLALGASRSRLVRQLLTESLLLAVPGGLLGLALARWGSRLLVGQIASPGGPARGTPVSLDLSLDARVLLFTLGVTVATALLFGIAPALRAGRLGPHDAIKRHGAGAPGHTGGTFGGPLVVSQVALSLVLVFAAGLFGRTFTRLAHRDLGLDSEGILLVGLDAQRSAAAPDQRSALFARAEESARALPGVARAAVSFVNPVSGMGWNERFTVEGLPALGDRESLSWMNAVTPGWFHTFGTTLRAGRDFDSHDRAGTPPVAVVNEAFARRFLGGRSPLGHVLRREGPPGHPTPPLEVVGVVEDSVYRSPRDAMEPIVFVPLAQLAADEQFPFATMGVRAAAGSPALLSRDLAAALAGVDPGLSLTFRLFSDQLDGAVRRERIVAGLSGFFGALALLLAGIGLYGVTAYGVSRRRGEIGVRMALGAGSGTVVRLFLGRSLRLVALGLAIGAGVSLWTSRFVSPLLYGLEPTDPATLLGAAAALTGVGLLAAGLPARRAGRIDPAQVLREG
jgi:putative ABC transport system permease protein